jgi:hypothetical protein
MKKILVYIVCTLFTFGLKAQSVIGAWENLTTSKNGDPLKSVVIFAEDYQVLATYHATTGAFIHTNGGTWTLEGDLMTEKVEFNSDSAEQVGTEVSFKIKITDHTLEIIESGTTFTKIDDGTPGALQGAWLMSGRIKDGESQTRDLNSPRKTMKMLSGTRFQWIAYNTETKQFMATGGGSYTTKDGEYIENIEFFSKDVSKVGLSLIFNYELIDGKWHHSGFSSKGDPIDETWTIRQAPTTTLEKN